MRGRIQGGGSTAVQRDKKLWDCQVAREKKNQQRKQMDVEPVYVSIPQLHNFTAAVPVLEDTF